jgi:hypothetical protein
MNGEVQMNVTNVTGRSLGIGMAMLATFFVGTTAAAAAPKIKVVKVAGSVTATQVQITVTGSGFAHGAQVNVEVDQGGAFSGNLPQIITTTASGSGTISVKKRTVNHSVACQIGVFAEDQKTQMTSNGVDLPIEPPCATPHLLVSSHNLGSNALIPSGNTFTPNPGDGSSSVTVEYVDTTDGFSVLSAAGVTNASGVLQSSPGHYHPDLNRCHHLWSLTAIDDDTDTLSNTVTVKDCELGTTPVDCTTVKGQGCP